MNDLDISRWQGVGSPAWPQGGRSPFPCPGCGESTWVELGGGPAADVYRPNLDISPFADISCNLEFGELPFHDEHADKVKAIHSLQHLSRDAARKVIRETYRILKPNGVFQIMIGDLDFVLERLREDGLDERWMNCLFHGPNDNDKFGFHKWGYNYKTISQELRDAGFQYIMHVGYYNRWEFKVEATK